MFSCVPIGFCTLRGFAAALLRLIGFGLLLRLIRP